MPFVQIYLRSGLSPEYRRAIGDGVHRALVETLGIPADDRFQVITQHAPADFIADPNYFGVARSDGVAFIRITLGAGRTLEQKRALYARIAAVLAEKPGVRPQDVFIVLVETAAENWSFGNGAAQYADRRPAWLPAS